MHQHLIFVTEENIDRDKIRLSGGEADYLLRVLRRKVGESITAFDGCGRTYETKIVGMDRRGALLQVQSAGRHPAAGYRIGIAQAHLKTKAMESMIKRCTELGASHFFFFPAERSVARRRERAGVQGDSVRWRKIAIEACRQSRRYFVPRFEPVRDSEQLAGRFARFDRVFVASLADDSVMIADLLKGDSLRAVRSVLIVVGPEGDFTPGELDLFRSAGALSCRLSEVVLRADTAAIASAAICAAHLAASHAASSGRMT